MYHGLTSTNKFSTLREVVVNQMLTEASREKNENIIEKSPFLFFQLNKLSSSDITDAITAALLI